MTHTVRTRLGTLDALPPLPAPITAGPQSFYLVRDGDGFRLLSTVCPHAGGAVYDAGGHFECPLHGWRFDRATGRSLNAPSRRLDAVAVTVEDGVLFAELPQETSVRVRHGGRKPKPGLTIQLHSHACLEVSYRGFSLLTDPWLTGPAFLGAWLPYPAPRVSPSDLRPNAILVTHEHSDHFHEPTLRRFDRHTPIVVPDFPNQRMPQRLADLGFVDVRVLRFGEPTPLSPGWVITAFEPQSFWNDAFVLIEVDGFRLFNINDAGVNARIASMVAPVDALAVQFSGGASGYPWTWTHLSDEEKVAIAERSRVGKLRLVRESARMYGALDVIPFASYFTVWHESHLHYGALMRRNSLSNVRDALTESGVGLIDLLPGDTWDVGAGVVRYAAGERTDLFDAGRLGAYRQAAMSPELFQAHYPNDESISVHEIDDYFTGLNRVPDAAFCEDLTFTVTATSDAQPPLELSFAVTAGVIARMAEAPQQPNLRITIPRPILTAIIRDGLSWDEAMIGYWCRFERYPNVYHAGFWRLLHSPYLRRAADGRVSSAPDLAKESTVAEILERHGPEADRILRRYGLYCAGCHHSTAESLEMAARQHSIDPGQVELLVRQLNQTFAKETDGAAQPVR